MTIPTTDEQRVEVLLAPLADLAPLPQTPLRRPASGGARRLAPVLAATACVAAVAVAVAVAVTAGRDAAAPIVGTTATGELGVWFVRDGAAVRVVVPVAAPDARSALASLLGPAPAGYTSAIDPATRLVAVDVADTIATVRLDGPVPTGAARQQVVDTLTELPSVRWVRFGDAPELYDRTIAATGVDRAPPIELVRVERTPTGVTVVGTADVFEANVQLRVTANGHEVATTFATATCGSGCRGSFTASIPVPPGTTGALEVAAFTRSAADGAEIDGVTVPVGG